MKLIKIRNGLIMKKIALFVILLVPFFLSAQDENSIPKSNKKLIGDFTGIPSELIERCSTFFDIAIKDDFENAFKVLLKNSPINKKSTDLDNLLSETKRAVILYGKITGSEPVSSEIASPSYIRLRYISIHPDNPMRWVFTFYKSPTRGWTVNNVRFDDLTEFLFSDE